MANDPATIRRYLTQSLNDPELVDFCSDYFPEVGDEFTQGMQKSQKVRILFDYCRRRHRMHDLLAALARERPGPFIDAQLANSSGAAPITTVNREPITRKSRQIFISHANQDSELAFRLAKDLAAYGWQVWIAPDSIRPGEKWVEAINRGLAESGLFLLLLSDAAVQSQWVRSETNIAVQWEHQKKLRFIPLKVTTDSPQSVPALWLAYQQVDLTIEHKAGLEALLTELEPSKMLPLAEQYEALQEAVQSTAWERASSLGHQIEAAYPDYRQVRQYLRQADEAVQHNQQRDGKLESLYAEMTLAIRAREWEKALDFGEQIYSIGGLYRDVEHLMAQSGQILQQQRLQARLARLYLQLQAALKAGSWADALSYGQEIVTINPHYRKVQQLMDETREQLQRMPEQSNSTRYGWAWWAGVLMMVVLLGWGIRAAFTMNSNGSAGAATETAVAKAMLTASETPALPPPTIKPSATPTHTPTATFTATPTMTPTSTPLPTATLDPWTLPPQPTLGSTWIRPIDNMPMVYVPDGTFPMGSENAGSNELPLHLVTLDGFWFDQTEVTQAQYERCAASGACTPPAYGISTNNYPVVGVSWNNADSYCRWTGGSLPSEAQWEYAARGTEGFLYPWGNNSPTCDLAQFGACEDLTLPVGSFPKGASWVGALDMAGNVWEWVNDWYAEEFDQSLSMVNPAGPANGSRKVLRGGSWNYYQSFLRSTVRDNGSPINRYDSIGFRCARMVEKEK